MPTSEQVASAMEWAGKFGHTETGWAAKILARRLQAFEETVEVPLEHGMNCGIYSSDEDHCPGDCTCGLDWKIKVRTEQEMHRAWRKRAEEAESRLQAIEQAGGLTGELREVLEAWARDSACVRAILDSHDHLAAEVERLREQADKLQAFKDWTHARLDSLGVPAVIEDEHLAAGCRIGGRMDWIEKKLAENERLRGLLVEFWQADNAVERNGTALADRTDPITERAVIAYEVIKAEARRLAEAEGASDENRS